MEPKLLHFKKSTFKKVEQKLFNFKKSGAKVITKKELIFAPLFLKVEKVDFFKSGIYKSNVKVI